MSWSWQCLPILLALLPAALWAQEGLTVNDCDDASQFRGGSSETTLVRQGAGAVRWRPAESVSLETSQIPHDWSGGNVLCFWLHSARAGGSPMWLILSSEDPEKEGIDYYALRFRLDWEGWRELVLPFDELGKTRSPVGWHKIDRFSLHAAWDPEVEVDGEDELILDDIRVLSSPAVGPRMTDAQFFSAMDPGAAGLEGVRRAVAAGDYAAAKAAYREFFVSRREAKWFTNWWERAPVPERRPSTSRADAALEHVFSFDRQTYDLGPDIDWASNQRDEGEAATIEWNASLNRHFFLPDLARAYEGTLETRYSDEIVATMLDWIEDCPVLLLSSGNSPYHHAWETLNTACRAGDTWIEAVWRTADSPSWTPEALCTVLKSLVEHARHLRKWPSRGNWLTAESKALTIIGVLLPEFSEAADWRGTGIQRLYSQMGEEIYPDGLENELALGYNLWVLRNYADILDLALLNGRREEIPADYQSLLERMYNYLLYATGPDGLVPGLNDSGNASPVSYLKKAFGYFPHRTDFLWGATGGAEGTAPAETSYAFPYSGHYVMRSDWGPEARFLFLDAGTYGSGHQHEDKLSFTMAAHGRQWIVEGGSYMYDKSRWRRYVLSTRAHNTVRVDGFDQNRRAARDTWVLKPPFQPLPNTWITNEQFDYVSAVYEDGYGPERLGVTHRREVLFVKPDYWILVDTLTPVDDAPHTYETIFHINAEEAAARGARVSAQADGGRLDIIGVGKDLGAQVVKGVEEEPVQGWANYPWRPVPTALFGSTAAGRVVNAYVLHPSAGGEVEVTALGDPREQDVVAFDITTPDGGRHTFIRNLAADGERVPCTLGGITTDASVCVVRRGEGGRVTGSLSIGATVVTCGGAHLPANR